MRHLFLLFFSFSLLFSWNQAKVDKSLTSLDRSQIYAQNLIKKGWFDDADKFLLLARKKYINDFELLYWSGELYLEKGKLDKSEKYFRQALTLNPNHENSKDKIELISEQNSAKENKDVGTILDILSDKGLDFIMIFLAFLGSEIIAKRYNDCQNGAVYISANHYIHRYKLMKGTLERLLYIREHFVPKSFSFICGFIHTLIVITVAISILIPFLFLEFQFGLTWVLSESLLTMDIIAIESHVFVWFLITFSFTVFYIQWSSFKNLTKQPQEYAIALIEELDALFENNAYRDIVKVLVHLKDNKIKKDEVSELLSKYSANEVSILKFYP